VYTPKIGVYTSGGIVVQHAALNLKDSIYVTRKDILGCNAGITRAALDAAVSRRKLLRVVLPGMTYGRYRRADVVRVFGLGEAP
jgi:hypothetical protein